MGRLCAQFCRWRSRFVCVNGSSVADSQDVAAEPARRFKKERRAPRANALTAFAPSRRIVGRALSPGSHSLCELMEKEIGFAETDTSLISHPHRRF